MFGIVTMEAVVKAERTLDFIERHQSNWDQGLWLTSSAPVDEIPAGLEAIDCDTVGCYAGWFAVLNGIKIYQQDEALSDDVLVDENGLALSDRVADELGIERYLSAAHQKDHPFHSKQTLKGLRKFVTELRQHAEGLAQQAGVQNLEESRG